MSADWSFFTEFCYDTNDTRINSSSFRNGMMYIIKNSGRIEPSYGDEINLVDSGFNSGWRRVQGMSSQYHM